MLRTQAFRGRLGVPVLHQALVLRSHLGRGRLAFFLSQLPFSVPWHALLPAALLPPQLPTHLLPCSNHPKISVRLSPPVLLSFPSLERGKSSIESATEMKMQSWVKIRDVFLGVVEHRSAKAKNLELLMLGDRHCWGGHRGWAGGSWSPGALAESLESLEQWGFCRLLRAEQMTNCPGFLIQEIKGFDRVLC